MTPESLEKQTLRVDASTKALVEAALEEATRGEILTEEEAEAQLDEAYQEWQEKQKVALPA